MKDKFIYYDAKMDRIFTTDYQHHTAYGLWFYPAHDIIYLGEL